MNNKTSTPLNPEIIYEYNRFLSKRTLKADLLRDFFYNLACLIDPEEKTNYEVMIEKAVAKASHVPEDEIQELLTQHYTFTNAIQTLIEEIGGKKNSVKTEALINEAITTLIKVSEKGEIHIEAVVFEEGTYILQNILYNNDIWFSPDREWMKKTISQKLSPSASNIMIELIDTLSTLFAGIDSPTTSEIQHTIKLTILLASELYVCTGRDIN